MVGSVPICCLRSRLSYLGPADADQSADRGLLDVELRKKESEKQRRPGQSTPLARRLFDYESASGKQLYLKSFLRAVTRVVMA